MNRFKILVTAFLSIVLGAGVATGVAVNNKHVDSAQAEAAVNGSKSVIVVNDNYKGNYRSLCLSTYSFADGYSVSDLKKFVENYYGTKQNSEGTVRTATTKCYYWPADSYCYINSGATGNGNDTYKRTFELPGWLLNVKVEVANSGSMHVVDMLKAPRKWTNNTNDKHSSAVGKTLTVNTNSWGSDTSVNSTAVYFNKVNITKNYLNSEKAAVKETSSESVYQYYKYSTAAPTAISGYDNDGYWYTDNSFTTKYSSGLVFGGFSLYALYTNIQYNVTEYEVVDGVVSNEPIASGSRPVVYEVNQADKAGYVSKGVFLDKDGKTPYTGTISGATTLYHVYESEVYDYLYLGGMDINSDWCGGKVVNFYLYTFNEETNEKFHGEWPGTKITISDYVAIGSNFNGYGYYRLPLLANGLTSPTHFIIATDKVAEYACQSADLEINFGSYYLMDELFKGATVGLSGDVEDGEQAALAYDLNLLRLNGETISYDGKEYQDSICAITYDDANDIITRYQNLTENDKFNGTKYYTHNVDGKSTVTGGTTFIDTEADYTASEIISVLMRKYDITSKLNFLAIRSSDSPVISIIVIVSMLSLGAIVLVIRRRKQTSK